jgi:uncharacterized protein YndB with AHSA1/START domain
MPKTNLHQHAVIEALPSKVWRVLTSPDYMSQYLFEGITQCRWNEGQPLIFTIEEDEKTEVVEKGNLLRFVPGVLLQYNLTEDNLGNQTITFELIPAEEGVELKLRCEGFEDSEEQYLIRLQQVKLLLQKIKWLAEYA